MPIGTSIALAAGLGMAGSIGGAAIGANAAGNAADTQANAALQAAQIEGQTANNALNFQENQYQTGQAELAPWLQGGATGLANLEYLMGLPVQGTATIPGAGGGVPGINNGQFVRLPGGQGGEIENGQFHGLTAAQWNADAKNPITGRPLPYGNAPILSADQVKALGGVKGGNPNAGPQTESLSSLVNPSLGPAGALAQPFTPPQLNNTTDPGYLARLKLGEQALDQGAAARGGLLTGGTARAEQQFGQDYASNEYQNVYNRAFNTFETNQQNLYNRLAAMSGLGQQTATTAGALGNNSANSIANTLLTLGQMQGTGINNAAAARASGYIGGANAWGGALGNLGNYATLLPMMNLLQGQQNQPYQPPGTFAPGTTDYWNSVSTPG